MATITLTHPRSYALKTKNIPVISALLHGDEEICDLMRHLRFLELRVIGVWVVKDTVLFNDSGKINCVKNKQYRSKDSSLWNTEWAGNWFRGVAVDADRLSAVYKVDENNSKAIPCVPKTWWSRWNNMLWSILSKAADKSKRASRETFSSSKERRRSITILRSAVWVLCSHR